MKILLNLPAGKNTSVQSFPFLESAEGAIQNRSNVPKSTRPVYKMWCQCNFCNSWKNFSQLPFLNIWNASLRPSHNQKTTVSIYTYLLCTYVLLVWHYFYPSAMVSSYSTVVDHNSDHDNGASMLGSANLCTTYSVTWTNLEQCFRKTKQFFLNYISLAAAESCETKHRLLCDQVKKEFNALKQRHN